ncbi:MAG: prepilin-type N-terminal cleavage/methylation domain-containing protein [Cyanobacteria bacterium J06648_10]
MKSAIFLYQYLLTLKKQSRKGFTLIELLVSLIISGLIISTLLYVVVDLVSLDNREARLNQVQLDTKRALDYITNDLQEAVYIYQDPAAISAQLTGDSRFPTPDANTFPVLAFWRIDPVDNLPDCTTGSLAFQSTCQVLSIRRATYTLVVYIQRNNDGNRNWPGQSRLIRYELTKYSDINTLAIRPGYKDPTDSTVANSSFETWTSDGVPSGNAAVLVDYIASPDLELNRAPLADAGAPCSSYGNDGATTPVNLYSITPTTASSTANTSFFACIRNPDPDNDPTTTNRANQDVYVFLRGAAQGEGDSRQYGYSESTSLPLLETQVLVRGIIDKNL